MPTSTTGAFGRLARKLVNDNRTVQINGKMLIASSSTIVGVMKSQATARSDRPRTRRANTSGVACAARSASEGGAFITRTGFGRRPNPLSSLDLTVFLEHLLPVGHQPVECLLRRAFVGDHEIVDALLFGQQQLRVAGVGPEVDHL